MEKMGKEIDRLSNELTALRWRFWEEYTLFTWQWWSYVAACVLFVVLAVWLLRRKELVPAIAYYGIAYLLNRNLDDWATMMDWYDYRMQLEPTIPTNEVANIFAVPISLMLLYHRLPTWKSYGIGLLAFAAAVAYGALPMMKLANIYALKEWNSHWSFLSLLVIGTIAKAAVDAFRRLEGRTGMRDRIGSR
jgi:hypothetical protein